MTSVIIPVYNVEQYLCECIDSVLSQTYSDYEIILVNDGSTDSSGIICDNYARANNSIRVIHKNNGGLSEARNYGVATAVGDFVLFLDSDDRITANALEILNDKIANCDLVIFGYKKFRSIESKDEFIPTIEESLPEGCYDKVDILKMFKINSLPLVTACFKFSRTEIVKANPFPLGKVCEDEFIAHRFINSCNRITVINDCLYLYRENPNGITHSKSFYRNTDRLFALADRLNLLQGYGLTEAIGLQSYNFYLFFCGSYPFCRKENKKKSDLIYLLFLDQYRVLLHNPYLTIYDKIKLISLRFFPGIFAKLYMLFD